MSRPYSPTRRVRTTPAKAGAAAVVPIAGRKRTAGFARGDTGASSGRYLSGMRGEGRSEGGNFSFDACGFESLRARSLFGIRGNIENRSCGRDGSGGRNATLSARGGSSRNFRCIGCLYGKSSALSFARNRFARVLRGLGGHNLRRARSARRGGADGGVRTVGTLGEGRGIGRIEGFGGWKGDGSGRSRLVLTSTNSRNLGAKLSRDRDRILLRVNYRRKRSCCNGGGGWGDGGT